MPPHPHDLKSTEMGPSQTTGEWAKSIPDPRCANCNAQITGEFCSQCGQQVIKERLSFKTILVDFPRKVLNLEQGLFFTVVRCYAQVGQVAKEFCSGKRKPYVNPVGFFLLGATVQLLAVSLKGGLIEEQIAGQFSSDPKVSEMFADMLGENAIQQVAHLYLNVMLQAYTYLALFGFALPLALALWFFQKRMSDSDCNFAESLVFSLYCTGLVILTTGLLAPITVSISFTLHGIMGMVVFIIVPAYGTLRFYKPTVPAVLTTMFATLFGLVCFLVTILTVFAVNLIVAVMSHKAAGG